jgi:hypothetical protein
MIFLSLKYRALQHLFAARDDRLSIVGFSTSSCANWATTPMQRPSPLWLNQAGF